MVRLRDAADLFLDVGGLPVDAPLVGIAERDDVDVVAQAEQLADVILPAVAAADVLVSCWR